MNFFKKYPFVSVVLVFMFFSMLINIHNIFMVAILYFLSLFDAIFTNITLKKLYMKKGKKAFEHELNPVARSIYMNHSFEYSFAFTFLLAFTIITSFAYQIVLFNRTDPFWFMLGMFVVVHIVHLNNFKRLK